MTIRELLASDREPLNAMVESVSSFRDDDVEIALELIDDRIDKGDASDYEFLVAADGDEVLGYVCFGRIPLTVSSYDLYWIVVAPRHQRKGVGARLMAAMEERVAKQGGGRIYIDTSSNDAYAATRGFYESQGYAVAAELPDFYRPGEGKVVYWKALARA